MPAIRDRITEIRKIPGRELIANPLNPRKHPSEQRSALRGILEDVGAAGVILAYHSPRHGGELVIIDGHLRTEDNPDFLWTVAVLDVNDQEADLLLATHDPLGAMASVDPDLMKSLLESLSTENAGVQQMLDEIAKANALEIEPAAGLVDPDDIPPPPAAPISQPGDLWSLGKHRLLVGDSAIPAELDRLLAGEPIHLVNTDPPYNVQVQSRTNNAIAAGMAGVEGGNTDPGRDVVRQPGRSKPNTKNMRAKDRPISNDLVSEADFERMLDGWFANLARALLPGHAFYIWGGYANLGSYMPALKRAQLRFAQVVVWDKQAPVLTRKDYMGTLEICFHGWKTGRAEPVCWLDFKSDMAIAFYGWRDGAGHRYFGPNNAKDLWHVKNVAGTAKIHLTEKPVELAVRAMQYSSKRGENVLDLFGGSGSTLIAAEMTGRRCFTMELDLPYADTICQRFLNFTGIQPVRESDGTSNHFKPTSAAAAA